MLINRKLRRAIGRGVALLTLFAAFGPGASVASAAGTPTIGEVWASSVFSSTVRLQAKINPNEAPTAFHIDYITQAAYEANVNAAKDGFTGTQKIPAAVDAEAGSGASPVTVLQILSSLTPDTAYRYRVVAHNPEGTASSPTLTFATQILGSSSFLADNRGWEMVSPVDKNGGQVDPPGALAGGGVLQAAANGQSVTYGSAASFGEGATGAATASQYIATRTATGWTTQNITAPLYSGSYGTAHEGVPYQLFSGDLARGLLLNGRHCRGEETDCAVANPPLPGTGAPAGYQNYYLRNNGAGSFTALIGASEGGMLSLEPADFSISLAGASPDLQHVVLSTCAALTPDAIEVPEGEGCEPEAQNLYEYSPGAGLSLVNLLPAQSHGSPGAALGAQAAAVSTDGGRVYWNDLATGNLYLRAGGQTKQVDAAAGGGGVFETASTDGSIAFYTKAGHLYRYDAAAQSSTDLTPTGEVEGVLGASADGTRVYYLSASGLYLWHSGMTSEVAETADESNYPPASGTARVSADGTRLVFVATAPLTGYDNKDLKTGELDSQVYLYDAGADSLACVSCNPTHARPIGPSTIPGAIANGEGADATKVYKPRVLTTDGRRLYFDSVDALGLTDTNNLADVYQWEAQGEGSCTRPAGCVTPISSGRSEEGATFVDASADGSDVFFLTDRALVSGDLAGSVDLYDARVGGGFPEPPPPLACAGDACQSLPPTPVDPTLTTKSSGPGNPPVHYPKQHTHCKGGFVKRKGNCVKLKSKKQSSRKRHHNRGAGR
jgi:hypothetical protein